MARPLLQEEEEAVVVAGPHLQAEEEPSLQVETQPVETQQESLH